ncbi:cell division protein PerM, partial [Frankia sp. CcWB2]
MQPPRLPRRLADRIWQRGGRPLAEAVAASAAGLIFIEFVVLVVWGADTGSSTGPAAALRVGADLWLAAHGTTLRLPDGIIAFRPLGLALFPLAAALSAAHRRASAAPLQSHAVLNRTPLGRVSLNRVSRLRPARLGGGRSAASVADLGDSRGGRCRSDGAVGVPWRAVAGDVIGVVGAQTLFVVVVALIVRTHSVRPTPGSAALGTVAFGIPAALLGALAGRHRLRTAWRMLPVMLRVPLLSGAAAFMALLAAAAFGVALVLAATEPEVAAAERSLDVGVLGGLGLTATQLALLPNLVLWGLSYALGPGFRTGPGLVRADVVRPADLPDLPVLTALPPSALPRPGWLVLALVPVVAGVVLT